MIIRENHKFWEALPYTIFAHRSGENVHIINDFAVQYAAQRGYLDIVKYLVSVGADVHARGDWALFWAEQYGHTEIVEYLKSCL